MTMYGLPKDFDGASLVGRSLQQICFGQYEISLRFDENLMIQVESSLRYQDRSALAPETIELPALQSNLMQLLGHSIAKASGDKQGTLTLEFEDGQILQCLEESSPYESYQIIQGDD